MADLVAAELATLHEEIQITTFTAVAEAFLKALLPDNRRAPMAVPKSFWYYTFVARHMKYNLLHSLHIICALLVSKRSSCHLDTIAYMTCRGTFEFLIVAFPW